jgi:hypothetical protein
LLFNVGNKKGKQAKPKHLKHNESIPHEPNALSTNAKAGLKNIMLINEMILKKLKNCKKNDTGCNKQYIFI